MLKRKEVKPTKEDIEKKIKEIEIKEREEKTNRDVLNMKFHDIIYVDSIYQTVLRVQSGWIYQRGSNSIFVIDTRE